MDRAGYPTAQAPRTRAAMPADAEDTERRRRAGSPQAAAKTRSALLQRRRAQRGAAERRSELRQGHRVRGLEARRGCCHAEARRSEMRDCEQAAVVPTARALHEVAAAQELIEHPGLEAVLGLHDAGLRGARVERARHVLAVQGRRVDRLLEIRDAV